MKIDGVDVSRCEYLHQNVICGKFCTHCEQNPNCYFKQLKQKEKEIEELKNKIKLFLNYLSAFCASCEYHEGKCFGRNGYDLQDTKICTNICPELYQKIFDRFEEIFDVENLQQIINEVEE